MSDDKKYNWKDDSLHDSNLFEYELKSMTCDALEKGELLIKLADLWIFEQKNMYGVPRPTAKDFTKMVLSHIPDMRPTIKQILDIINFRRNFILRMIIFKRIVRELENRNPNNPIPYYDYDIKGIMNRVVSQNLSKDELYDICNIFTKDQLCIIYVQYRRRNSSYVRKKKRTVRV